MKPPVCPRCQEAFAATDQFCERCGIRKGRVFGQGRWWLIACLVQLLVLALLLFSRELVLLSRERSPNADPVMLVLLICGVILSSLPLPIFFVAWILFRLWKYGVATTGTVISNDIGTIRINESTCSSQASRVSFVPDVADPPSCLVEADGWLEIGSQVEVFYDPYHPKRCPVVGSKPLLHFSMLAILGFLIYTSLLFLGILAVLAP